MQGVTQQKLNSSNADGNKKIPSIDWEGLKSDFIDACKRLHYHQLFNWLKTNLQDYIK